MTDPQAKSNIPWSIKGVSREARDAAKKAAAAQGDTMGEWLTLAIRSGDHGQSGALAVPSAEPGVGTVETASVPAPRESNLVDGVDPADRLRRAITDQIEQSENRILGVVAPLQDIIQQMALRIEALENRRTAISIDPSASSSTETNGYRKTGWDD